MPDQENQATSASTKLDSLQQNNNQHNPLNDHDYCSPNKRIIQNSYSVNKSDATMDSSKTSTNLPLASESFASASSSSLNDKQINDEAASAQNLIPKTFTPDDANLSDSSDSSSSLSSSVASSKDLVIAQDSLGVRAGSIVPPKDTPSVARPRPGRPPKKELDPEARQALTQGRSRRPRQNTSVTDKSEWIMGDDQIDSVLSEHLEDVKDEKRKSKEGNDSALSQYTSSNYSSSDAESDEQGSDYNSEDDPDRLWCVCRRPHDNKFMICCDVCKDWFHGHCVGVTKLMGDRFEKEGKEWFCGECQEKLRAGIPRNAIPTKLIKKEKKKKKSKQHLVPGKRGRGRPRKSETVAKEGATRFSLRNAKKSMSSLDPKQGVDNGRLKKNLARPDARSESFGEFENQDRLKELIKERKKEFFYKRRLAEMQKAEKRNALGIGKQSLTSLSDSLDSLATSTSTPNMSNLPINIKSDAHKERSKPNIVLQINTKKDPGDDQANPRIVTAIVRKKSKHSESTSNLVAADLFTADPIQINKKTTPSSTPTNQTAESSQSGGESRRTSTSSGSHKFAEKADSVERATPKKKRKNSESSNANGSTTPIGSKHIAQKIKDSLEERSRKIEDLDMTSEKIETLAAEIEGQLNECFKEGTPKYLNKFRSLLFNLRDIKNEALVKNVLTGEISPQKLVRMSPDEMASSELAKWRERENKHSIELIKRDAQLAAQQVIVKKTHKGEEVISTPLVNEPDDQPAGISQEPPSTPTKLNVKDNKLENITTTPPPTNDITKAPSSIKNDAASNPATSKKLDESLDTSGSNDDTSSLPFSDTTKDHKNHVFDMNCKICTKQELPETKQEPEKSVIEGDKKNKDSEPPAPEPKRLRISIDTKLDPESLTRMREPLIKPTTETPMDVDDPSLSRTPPIEPMADDVDEEDDSYDPEFQPTPKDEYMPELKSDNELCWSGTITMPDVASFSAMAKPVSGVVNFLKDGVGQNLMVCGRIAPDQVQGYIKKLKTTTKNQIFLVQLHPSTSDDKGNFDTLFDYLYSRNRCGVIKVDTLLKDFYILPIHERSSIPEILKPIRGPGLNRTEGNCLLGLLVKAVKRSSSTSSSSISSASYTPTPIK